MTLVHRIKAVLATVIIASGMTIGAGTMAPTVAYAAPSSDCSAMNNGNYDLAGSPGTQNLNLNMLIGEVITITLLAGVTNSLFRVNGSNIVNGQTSGVFTFAVTVATLAIIYDITGTGGMQLRCTANSGSGGGSTPAMSNQASSTLAAVLLSGPLGPYFLANFLRNALFFSVLNPRATSCGYASDVEERIRNLRRLIAERERLLDEESEKLREARANAAEADIFAAAAALTGNETTFTLVSEAREAAAEVSRLVGVVEGHQNAIDTFNGILAELLTEYELVPRCSQQSDVPGNFASFGASGFAPQSRPAILGPNGPFFAFNGSSDRPVVQGATQLLNNPRQSLWVDASGSFVVAGGPNAVGGGRANVGIAGSMAVGDDGVVISARLGGSAGQTRIGSSSTVNNFTALNAVVMFAHEIGENIQLSGGVFGGYSWNSITIGTATGSFGSTAFGGFGQLAMDHAVGTFIVQPSVNLTVTRVVTNAYTLSNGTAVAATGNTQFAANAGVKVSRPHFDIGTGAILTPFVEGQLGYAFNTSPSLTVAAGSALALNAVNGSLGAGLEAQLASGLNISVRGTVGASGSGVASVGGSVSVGGTF